MSSNTIRTNMRAHALKSDKKLTPVANIANAELIILPETVRAVRRPETPGLSFRIENNPGKTEDSGGPREIELVFGKLSSSVWETGSEEDLAETLQHIVEASDGKFLPMSCRTGKKDRLVMLNRDLLCEARYDEKATREDPAKFKIVFRDTGMFLHGDSLNDVKTDLENIMDNRDVSVEFLDVREERTEENETADVPVSGDPGIGLAETGDHETVAAGDEKEGFSG